MTRSATAVAKVHDAVGRKAKGKTSRSMALRRDVRWRSTLRLSWTAS